jgi:hypothetical protein
MPAEGFITDIESSNRSIRELVEARNRSRCTDTPTAAAHAACCEPETVSLTNSECRTVTPPYDIDGDDCECCTDTMPIGQFGRVGSPEFLRILDEIKSLHVAKSQDYGSDEDPLANIRAGADLIGVDPWKACLVRIADKVTRLRTFCHKGSVVFDGLEDTLKDLSAYAALALAFYREQHRP